MASDLLSIALSGTRAARTGLDVTAHNIANASTAGYVRRSISLKEVSGTGAFNRPQDFSLSGVRLDSVVRNADMFRQAEVRRTGADSARAGTEVRGLENIAAAIEQSRAFPAMVEFEGALERLAGDPTDPSLRAGVIEAARTMTGTFNIAANGLDGVSAGLQFDADAGVADVNTLANELARVNLRLARASDASSDQSTLLDQRDNLLERISTFGNIATTFAVDGQVEVRLGGSSGERIVQGGAATALTMATAADGTLSFSVGAASVALSGGSLAGQALALDKLAETRSQLDAVADSLMATVNAAQANGAALDGSAGVPLFSGSGASGMTLAFANGSLLATAPAGSTTGSRNPGNLDALRSALASADPAGGMDALIFDISSTVSSRRVTQGALDAIAGNARVALESQAGVDLDEEAVNLVRYQQAFQASGKAMQIAGTIFDTLLGLK
ncbi:flagellar hook-associated protein FlgK [Novosphingobium sp. TH158]|uniref:flagellar hook-associated protein FlgK n=1 Tax=Novosphingobium sp. TH158 TaxID=2067455 RepID=UPI000C7BFD41|nr:flagellar hook-associated protein FlgK [Novosphingobium sp. TH158]PLK27644.1 flagellar hook-associated protein FlgK [Novosphingobium sp. TH158]